MTIGLVKDERLQVELVLRNVTCEVPGCELTAVGVIKTGLAALICADHRNICALSKVFEQAVANAIIKHLQGIMAITAAAAYENNINEVVFLFDGDDLLAQARKAMDVLDKTETEYRRRKTAEKAAADLVRFKHNRKEYNNHKKHPLLADINETNKEEPLIDIFEL